MRTRLYLTTAAAAAVLALSGCGSDTSDDATESSSPTASPQKADMADSGADTAETGSDARKDVTITKSGVEDHDTWGKNAYVVHYKITNSGDDTANYFAMLKFLDSDGDTLGSTGVNADELGPGKSSTGDTAPLNSEIKNGKKSDIRDVRITEVERTATAY